MRMDEHEVDDEDEVDNKDEIDSFDYGLMNDDAYAMSLMLYLVAKFLKQRNVVQQIWIEILQKDMEKLKRMIFQIKPILFIAASIADEKNLRLVLEKSDDCTIVDKHGRTALHHAADATLIEITTLLDCPWIGYCFSIVKDLCKAQRKWSVERKQMTAMFPQNYLEKQSETEKMKNVERRVCILMLLQAGVDLTQEDKYKKVPDIGPTNDTEYQIWWYNTMVKDTMDKKSGFNQAASALSVVGTLVAATSYIGPLQPPMTYDGNGYVRVGVKLVEVFMVSNSLAFYLAMTSVIFAMVPALPMPRESVLSELKRAQRIVASSLGLLFLSIIFIIISFAVASMVVIQDHESFNGSGLLTFPSIIGWVSCLIAIVSFLIRIMRLVFYDNPTIRWIYQFRLAKFCKEKCKDIMHSEKVHSTFEKDSNLG